MINDCILHDSSYSSVFELSGDEETLKAVLDSCCDAQGAGPSSLRYVTLCHVVTTPLILDADIRPVRGCFQHTYTSMKDIRLTLLALLM